MLQALADAREDQEYWRREGATYLALLVGEQIAVYERILAPALVSQRA